MQDANESLHLLIDMLSSATFDTDRMKEEAGKGFSTATELADSLVRTYGLPFRTAHTIVGRAVQKGDLSLSTLEKRPGSGGEGYPLWKKDSPSRISMMSWMFVIPLLSGKLPEDPHPLQSGSP